VGGEGTSAAGGGFLDGFEVRGRPGDLHHRGELNELGIKGGNKVPDFLKWKTSTPGLREREKKLVKKK